jgi:hypothetical protein
MPGDDGLHADPVRWPEAVLKDKFAKDPAAVVEKRHPVDALFEQQYHPLVRFMMICGASDQDAQDATQEAL